MKKESSDVIKIKKVKEPKVREPKQQKIRGPINKEGLIIAIVIAVVILLTVGIVLYYFCFADNEKVATYDGGELTRGEYEMYYKRYAPYYVYYYGYSATDIIPEIAQQAVIDEILYAKALKENYKIKDEDKTKIDEMFASEDNIKAIQEQELNVDEMKKLYYQDAIIASYIEDMKTKVTTEEMKAYIIENEGKNPDFNIYNTSHILLQFKENITAAEKVTLKRKAEALLKKAQAKGADFAKLAKENSDDSSKDDGGKVAIKKNGSVYEEYMNAVLKLKAGQIYSSVVESLAGYHIIKLNSIDKNGRLTDETEISYYVNEKAYKLADEANYEADTDRITQLGTEIGTELGLITQPQAATSSTESTAATAE